MRSHTPPTIKDLEAEWSVLSNHERQAAWDRFTLEIDEGTAGWNRYRPLLWPAFERGMGVDQIATR